MASSAAATERIVAGIGGDKAQREAAYSELSDIANAALVGSAQVGAGAESAVGVALACVAPIAEQVFAADASTVDAAEFHRASAVLAELMLLDPLEVGAEFFRDGRYGRTWSSPHNAYNEAWAKDPAELSRADAITVASDMALNVIVWARGVQAVVMERAGVDFMGGFYTMFVDHLAFSVFNSRATDAQVERMFLLLLELIQDEAAEPSDVLLGGAWHAIGYGLSGRPALGATLVEAGIIDAAVATLRKITPAETVSWKTTKGIWSGGVLFVCWSLSTFELPGMNKTQIILEKGLVDVCISALKALESKGASKVDEANPCGIVCCILLFGSLDLTAPEAAPIMRMLEQMPSTLNFLAQHDLLHIPAGGWTSAANCSALCALAFGKQEGGGSFTFSQEQVDHVMDHAIQHFSGPFAPFLAKLPPFFLRATLHLCISDANKALLLHSEQLLPLLLEALLLDPEHPRQAEEQDAKAAVQRDAVECFFQLAVFEEGKELLQQTPVVLDALRTLVGGAWTEEARQSAEGALMILDPDRGTGGGAGYPGQQTLNHVMLSYCWDDQDTIVRVNESLKRRMYTTWLDVRRRANLLDLRVRANTIAASLLQTEQMKGSIMDAMSDAVEGAEVVLYGISRGYKESANCRLEANYAMQQE